MEQLKFVIISDAQHAGDDDLVSRIVLHERPDAVLDCGDHRGEGGQNHYPACDVPRYFVHGNNEDWAIVQAIRDGAPYAPRNWRAILPAEETIIAKGGTRVPILGMGGVYGSIAWNNKLPRAQAKPAHFVHEEAELFYARKFPGFANRGILLFHDPPQRVDTELHRGSSMLNAIVDHLQPQFVFAGHLEEYRELRENGVRYVVLAPPAAMYATLTLPDYKLTIKSTQTELFSP
jgi:Icc-related predicted phosphoesterase